MCDTWIDHKGAKMSDGSPATKGSLGWRCICCNYRVRQKPRNRIYKEKFHQNTAENIDKTNELIGKTLSLLKDSKSVYLSDMKKILSISEEEIKILFKRHGRNIVKLIHTSISDKDVEFLIPRLSRIEGITKKEIQHDGKILEILFEYTVPKDGMMNHEIQKTYDDIWYRYTASGLSRSLYVKYKQHISTLDADIKEIMNKKFISLQINDKILVGIILQKSKIILDFKLPISKIDDPLKMLHDISNVGSWTSGKSRLNVSDEDILEYGIKITKQCYDHIVNLKLDQKPKKIVKADIKNEDNIDIIAQQMIDNYSKRNKLDKNLQRNLTNEYLESRSIKSIIKNHPDIPKANILQHLKTPLRLPKRLKELNETGLHSDPKYSLHIALFATDYYEWDSRGGDTEDKVVDLAKTLAVHVNTNMPKNKQQMTKSSNVDGYGLSAAIATWIAVALLHKEHGMNAIFSRDNIIEKTIEKKLCNVSWKTLSDHVSGYCVANSPTTTSSAHRKTYRVASGVYRLYRRGEPHHPTRLHCKIAPLPVQLPDEYKDLRRWYDEEYCKANIS